MSDSPFLQGKWDIGKEIIYPLLSVYTDTHRGRVRSFLALLNKSPKILVAPVPPWQCQLRAYTLDKPWR